MPVNKLRSRGRINLNRNFNLSFSPPVPPSIPVDLSGLTNGVLPTGWTPKWNTSTSWTKEVRNSVPVIRNLGPLARRILTLDAIGSVENIEIKAKVWISGQPTIGSQNGLVIRASNTLNNSALDTAYMIFPESGVWKLAKVVAGTHTNLQTLSGAENYTANAYHWLRLRANGNSIKAKKWLDGNSEPNWQAEVIDNSITIGLAGVLGIWDIETKEYASFSYSLDGGTA